MNLVPVLASLFVLLFLTALVGWLVHYSQFNHSVEKRWAAKVLQLLRDAENCIRLENRQLRELKKERDGKAHSLREEAFAAMLCECSVDELEAYPGIGPGTVGKLRAAGFVSLAKLQRAKIHIHGLGARRLSDINYAVRNLLGKARSTFEAGNCRQAQELVDRLETLSIRYEGLETKSRTRARAAEGFVARLGESVKHARAVTFWRWLRPISKEALVPAELLEVSLPDLEAALQTAEQQIAPSQVAASTPMSASNSEPEKRDEDRLAPMELTIQFALGVARKDGPVTATERELIRQSIRQRFSDNRALLNRAETLCAHYQTAAIDLERCLGQINRKFTADTRTALMELAGQIVAVSGKETAGTTPFLLHLAQSLDVPPLALPQREQPVSSPSAPPVVPPSKPAVQTKDECRSVLEIPAETPLSADLVRRQWNLLSRRLDSEKVASLGPEFVKLAEAKLAALRRAAESLLETMGEKLETKPAAPPVQDLRHNPDLDDVFGGM
jgi:uncharacterized tellurite resistance protein B-like protein